MNRDEFLARVRSAAAAGRAYRVHHAPGGTAQPAYLGAGNDAVATMAAEVNTVGGQAHVVGSLDEARATLVELLRHYSARRALVWQHPLLARLGLPAALAELAIERLDYERLSGLEPNDRRMRMEQADIGITSATVAIAETGTLAMSSAPGSERLASLLPPVHVAIVERGQIIADLYDWAAALLPGGDPGAMPSNVTLITGPSKTGDLGLRLTTGVHGPGHWHVIIVNA